MKILVTGPESTGKSTISQFIADEFEADLIPEYARHYLDINGKDYRKEDLLTMAKNHFDIYKKQEHSDLLVCDTFLLNIKIWSTVKYGSCDPWILNHLNELHFDVVFLASPEVPWQEDPLRENPADRDKLFSMFKEELESMSQNYILLQAEQQSRQNQVQAIIEERLNNAESIDTKTISTLENITINDRDTNRNDF